MPTGVKCESVGLERRIRSGTFPLLLEVHRYDFDRVLGWNKAAGRPWLVPGVNRRACAEAVIGSAVQIQTPLQAHQQEHEAPVRKTEKAEPGPSKLDKAPYQFSDRNPEE